VSNSAALRSLAGDSRRGFQSCVLPGMALTIIVALGLLFKSAGEWYRWFRSYHLHTTVAIRQRDSDQSGSLGAASFTSYCGVD
jgi:hypothetical protein